MLGRLRGVWSGLLQPRHRERSWDRADTIPFREIGEPSRGAFRDLGCSAQRPFFPHRFYCLPHAGPDGLRLAGWLGGIWNPDQLWQIGLFASGAVLEEFPPGLFMDDELVWHQQHFGLPGHIAFAIVAIVGQDLYGLSYCSDIVQRIGRRRAFKTRIENRFRAWPRLLVNAILAFAAERGLRRVWSPVSASVLAHVDPLREVGPQLFERVYDRPILESYLAERTKRWWVLGVEANRPRIVRPVTGTTPRPRQKTICICHDTERDWGHTRTDPAFAASIREPSRGHLTRMLEIESQAGAQATYSVVGQFLPEVREPIAAGGHAIAFHSFDHDLSTPQLARCRAVDLRIPGYRPPQSRRTSELREPNLCRHNFGWLATAERVCRTTMPTLRRRVVSIPILFDDYPLHRGLTSYEEWEAGVLAAVRQRDFVAFGLHDCYGPTWLPHYRRFLDRLQSLGALATLDQVARAAVLANAA